MLTSLCKGLCVGEVHAHSWVCDPQDTCLVQQVWVEKEELLPPFSPGDCLPLPRTWESPSAGWAGYFLANFLIHRTSRRGDKG